MQLLRALKPESLVYFDEYVGPSRFDWSEYLHFIGCERALLAAGMPSFYAVIVARPRRGVAKAIAVAHYAALRLRARIRAEWDRSPARP